MSRTRGVLGCLGILVVVSAPAIGQQPTPAMAETPAMPATPAVAAMPASPADGHTVHVTAPHVVAGKVMGPYHHYCKVLSPEPVIECLCYLSSDPNARLEQVEYILGKSITRTAESIC